MHYQNSISSWFPPEWNIDLLLSFPNTWTVTHFQMICLLFFSRFWPAFWSRGTNIYFVFSTFTSRPTSLLASIKVSGKKNLIRPPFRRVLSNIWFKVSEPIISELEHRILRSPLNQNFRLSNFYDICGTFRMTNLSPSSWFVLAKKSVE
jgi:hypothetical protein